jgi:hypothetical protein
VSRPDSYNPVSQNQAPTNQRLGQVGSKRFQASISFYTMADTATTVRLNVGGVNFEVSRSLIAHHGYSMLSRLVSDTWQADPEAIIFIDRDGETFRHCLDFLRYGRVSLPLTVAPKAFLRDMDYYGIAVDDASMVDVGGPFAQAATCIVECRKQIRAEIRDLEARTASLELADECLLRYSTDGSLAFVFPRFANDPNRKEHKLYKHVAKVNSECKELFMEYLEKYGFAFVETGIFKSTTSPNTSPYTICLKIAAPSGATPDE